jgi:heme exporter protein C
MLFVYASTGFTAMLAFSIAVGASVLFLRRQALWFDALAVSATETGLVFLTLNLIAGVFWSRHAGDIWWTWDPGITSALVCGLVYASYLMLRRAVEEPSQRAAFSAVWSIFCFLDMPIAAAAVYRWRALHPARPLWAGVPDGWDSWSGITDGWQATLALTTAVVLVLGLSLLGMRLRQQNARRERESARRMAQAM